MVVTGMAGLTALGGWLMGHAVLIGLGVSVALGGSLGVAAWFALKRTRAWTRVPACSTDETSEM